MEYWCDFKAVRLQKTLCFAELNDFEGKRDLQVARAKAMRGFEVLRRFCNKPFVNVSGNLEIYGFIRLARSTKSGFSSEAGFKNYVAVWGMMKTKLLEALMDLLMVSISNSAESYYSA